MVSKKVLIILIVVALLLAVISMVVNVSVSNMKEIPDTGSNSDVNIIPDKETGQVSLIINKPPTTP